MATNFFNMWGVDPSGGSQASPFVLARVIEVVYGPYLSDGKTRNPDYNNITDLGKIRYVIANSSQQQDLIGLSNRPARPFFAYTHQYPINNEYVYLVAGPGLGLNKQAGDIDVYYLPPIKLWGSQHQNAFPDLLSYGFFINGKATTYQDNQQGNTSKGAPVPMEYPLGYNFPEKHNIKGLVPFIGDVLMEGRYGNSIRFGSTVKSFKKFNTWSDSGTDGDPITIIRNGQGKQRDNLGYSPTTENVNIDQSSIYLTAGQSINIDDLASFPLTSWNTTIQQTTTLTVTLSAPPNANSTLSAQQQDNSTLPQEPQAPASTPEPTTTPTSTPTPTPPPPPEPSPADARGVARGEYTNNYNNKFELFSKKSGFTTTVYAYQKGTQNLIKTGMPSSTADISVLVREMQLSLADNNYYF